MGVSVPHAWCWFWFGLRNLARPQNQPNRIYNWLGLVWLWFWFGSEAPPDNETNPIGYYNIGSVLVWFQKPHQTTKPAQSVIELVLFGLVLVLNPHQTTKPAQSDVQGVGLRSI